jgi:hypothetical protein
MKIFKWTLAITDRQNLYMPVGAKLLTVQMQNEMPQLWALCNPEAPKETRTFNIIGTGNPIQNDPGQYIATFQINSGMLVFHVFESKD